MRAVGVLVFLLCATVSFGQTCKCKSSPHPQDWLCQASFALRGKVLGNVNEVDKDLMSVTVSVVHVYKGLNQLLQSESVESYGQIVYQVRVYFSAKCPLDFVKGADFLLTGIITVDGELHSSRCAWHASWDKLTVTHLKGLQSVYLRNCGCKADCGRWWTPVCRECGNKDPWGRPLVKACAQDHLYCGISDDWEKCDWKVMSSGYSKCSSKVTLDTRGDTKKWERRRDGEVTNVLASLLDD